MGTQHAQAHHSFHIIQNKTVFTYFSEAFGPDFVLSGFADGQAFPLLPPFNFHFHNPGSTSSYFIIFAVLISSLDV